MNFSKEDEFNSKFRYLLNRYVFSENNIEPVYRPNDVILDSNPSSNLFMCIEDRYRDLCSLTNLRLIILGNFVSNFLGIKYFLF